MAADDIIEQFKRLSVTTEKKEYDSLGRMILTEKESSQLTRVDLPTRPKGSSEKNTEFGHYTSHETVKTFLAHRPGAKFGEEARVEYTRVQNTKESGTIKTRNGNQVTDRVNDAKIGKAFREKVPLDTKASVNRAVTSYNRSKDESKGKMLNSYSKSLGEMTYANGNPGRNPKVKNIATQRSSPSVRMAIPTTNRGTPDMRYSAPVPVTKSGRPDMRYNVNRK